MNPAARGWLVLVPETVFPFAEVTPPAVLRRAVEMAVEAALDFVAADEAGNKDIYDPEDAREVIRRVAEGSWSVFTRDRLAEAVTDYRSVEDMDEAFDEGDLNEAEFRCFRKLDGLVSGIRAALDRLERGEKSALADAMGRRSA